MNELRKRIIDASYKAHACHIGSALSCVEILEAIYEVKSKGDKFIFSKASGVSAWYCKFFPEKASELLKAYPLPSREAGLIWSGGSLGMGLSVACGLALADRSKKVYVLMSDGELQEGQTWEAAMFASHHKLKNLIAVIDNNGMQALGKTKDICNLRDIGQKFQAFGWHATEVDGHNVKELKLALHTRHVPHVIVAKTIKGKGVKLIEDLGYKNHYYNLDEEGYKKAILCLNTGKST